MTWTHEKISQVPEVYRDFMVILKPILDSKRPEAILRITGIPFGRIASLLGAKYDYDAQAVRLIADNLRREDFVTEDTLGFFQPTAKGESFIAAVAHEEEKNVKSVPSLPVV